MDGVMAMNIWKKCPGGTSCFCGHGVSVSNVSREIARECQNNSSGGFTLVELIIAILLIAVIGVVGATSYSRALEKGKVRSLEAEMANLAKEYGRIMEASGAVTWQSVWDRNGWSNPVDVQHKPVIGEMYRVGYEKCDSADDECLYIELEYRDSGEADLITRAVNELYQKGIFSGPCRTGANRVHCQLPN